VGRTAHSRGTAEAWLHDRCLPLAERVRERFIGSVRRECLDHVIVWSAASLRRVLQEYVLQSIP
jgi:hypothetical protein